MMSRLPLPLIGAAIRTVYPRVEPELGQLSSIMPGGGTALDVGAWFGPWSHRMSRYAGEVVALEAHPVLADLLRRSLPRVRVVHAAASSQPGSIVLYVPHGTPAVGVSSVSEMEGGQAVTVPCVTIDSLELSDVRFIKLDIEGHELQALLGAEETIRRDRPRLLIELEERMQPVSEVVDLLASWGYTGYVRPGRSWIPLRDFDLVAHQAAAIGRITQSMARRLVWPRPRYVNMVLFRRSLV